MAPETPMYLKISQTLQAKIESGELRPGDRLPSEKELALHFNVSRITTGHALKILSEQGIIERHPGKGSFVRLKSVNSTAELDIRLAHGTYTASKAPVIGFVVPQLSAGYGLRIFHAISQAADVAGAFLTVTPSNGSQSTEEHAIQKLLSLGVDGLIIYPVNGEYYNPEILRLHLNQFPLILLDRHLPKIPVPFITTNNRAASYDLTRHLVELGHQHIGFLSPSRTDTQTLEERYRGYLAALADMGIALDTDTNVFSLPTGVLRTEASHEENLSVLTSFLQKHPEVTAIISTEYEIAVDVVQVCHRLGIAIPGDLSVACFDSPMTFLRQWRFTHIKQDEEIMGQQAVESLLRIIRGTPMNHIDPLILPGELVIGDSTDKCKCVASPKNRANSTIIV